MKTVKLIITQRFNFESKTYLVGETTEQIERVARRWVSRGIAKFADENYILKSQNYKHEKVSIVILVKDALDYVKRCIESLIEYTENYELIIVDNGSNSETKKWLSEFGWIDYTLIENKENKGVSYGWNQAIKVAKYNYICFLNSDTLLTPGWLGKLMKGFKYNKDVGIVGPSTCHSSTMQTMQILRGKHTINDQNEINRMAQELREAYIETGVVGFCWIISKKVFNKVGVFDWKRYGLATHEDLDLLWRASKAGFKSIWCMASYVHHFGNKTTREMGINPREIRLKNKKIFDERRKDSNLYIENDVELGKIKEVKSKIPILMITWNRLEYTKKAIEAIRKNTKNYILFIWDNNSTDGTKKYLKVLNDKNIEVHFEDKNVGLVPPMNYFFEKFKNYKYIAKVDNDTIVPKGWLDKLKEVLDELPLFAVEANHYLMLNYDIKENEDYYRHFYSVDFKGSKLYLSEMVGGTGVLIRRSMINEPIPEHKGTLSGWIMYQHSKNYVSAFYTGVWIDRLDQIGTNQYKKSDYPEYDKLIDKMRPSRLKPKKKIVDGMFRKTYERTKSWYERI
ncbi:MAG: glycosyltransferase [Methanofastidiosum sp.]